MAISRDLAMPDDDILTVAQVAAQFSVTRADRALVDR